MQLTPRAWRALVVLVLTMFSRGAGAQEAPPQETAPDTTPPPSASRSDINVKATSDFATYADTDHVFV